MEIKDLGEDRFLRKDPSQTDQTKSATYASLNPAPKRGDDRSRKVGRPKGSEEDDGAPNILTGTVIVACFIQTSALPSRIELQGNDLTFFDDSTSQNGKLIGDTSRLIFTHGSGKSGEKITEGFIWEKRASGVNSYDNVLSLYALPPRAGSLNYMYFGLEGSGTQFETNAIQMIVNHKNDSTSQDPGDGIWAVGGTSDGAAGAQPSLGVVYNDILGISGVGYSVFLAGRGTGVIVIGSSVTPLFPGLDIGTPSEKFGTFYGSVSACPLPTVESALEIIDRIPAPTFVGERGHYGLDRKYFDDLTFPSELLYTDPKGRVDIEHNHMLGFLLKAVIELKAEVDFLKNKTPNVV